jgi:hypothetical protein
MSVHHVDAIRQAKENGHLGAWVEPGPLLFSCFFCWLRPVIDIRPNQ